jgi:hypothetical protein
MIARHVKVIGFPLEVDPPEDAAATASLLANIIPVCLCRHSVHLAYV